MRVLIACEFSGTVRDAFRAKGHDAVSCDLLPCEKSGPHIIGDVLEVLGGGWDLMIAHPPCTFLCSSGLHWNNRGRGWDKTEAALEFVRRLLSARIPKIGLENPQGCIGTKIRPADQYIQPYEFGADASKKTGLWLKNLPLLQGTKRFPGRVVEWPRGSGKMVERWSNQTDSGQNALTPKAGRWAERSLTYQGIADAMADQWGAV